MQRNVLQTKLTSGVKPLKATREEILNTNFNFKRSVFNPIFIGNVLHLKNINNLEAVYLYNSLGRPVLKTKDNNIDFSDIAIGTYFLKVETPDGVKTATIEYNN